MTSSHLIDTEQLLADQLAQASPDLLRGLLSTFIAALMGAEAVLVFLILDKPETLSHNDVRLLRTQTHPRKCQKSHELGAFTSARQ